MQEPRMEPRSAAWDGPLCKTKPISLAGLEPGNDPLGEPEDRLCETKPILRAEVACLPPIRLRASSARGAGRP